MSNSIINPRTAEPNLLGDVKNLSTNITSAQASILRCKSALKNIEEGLLTLAITDCNTNCNNTGTNDVGQYYEPVELSAEPVNDAKGRTGRIPMLPVHRNRMIENKSDNKCFDEGSNEVIWDSNSCNIGGELTGLLRAQQRLICQIERLQCEVGDKAGLIDGCVKDTQYLGCRMKEVQVEIDCLHKELSKIRQEIGAMCGKERGFSPYANSSTPPVNPIMTYPRSIDYSNAVTPHRVSHPNSNIYFNDLNQTPGLHLQVKDGTKEAKTFEDMLRRSRLDMDCNINNCRNNNQAPCSISGDNKIKSNVNPLMKDFASLTSQIRGLRRMAETIFRNSYLITDETIDKEDCKTNSAMESTKPLAETTLSLLTRSNGNAIHIMSSEDEDRSTMNREHSSDTSVCMLSDDQVMLSSTNKGQQTYNCSQSKTKTLSRHKPSRTSKKSCKTAKDSIICNNCHQSISSSILTHKKMKQ